MTDMLKRMYELMEEVDIKPTQLAKELGLSTSTFSDWNKGKASPSLKAVMLISEYFKVSIDYIVYGTIQLPVSESSSSASNSEDGVLLEKFHQLPPDMRQRVIGYIDGMAANMPRSDELPQRLLG